MLIFFKRAHVKTNYIKTPAARSRTSSKLIVRYRKWKVNNFYTYTDKLKTSRVHWGFAKGGLRCKREPSRSEHGIPVDSDSDGRRATIPTITAVSEKTDDSSQKLVRYIHCRRQT